MRNSQTLAKRSTVDPTRMGARAARVAFVLCVLLFAGLNSSFAQVAGTCSIGRAQAFLDINNVRASVFNTGSLSYGGTTTAGNGFVVPKSTGKSPLFAAGLWVGGKMNGELRLAGARYGNYNFWPGPLGADARPLNPFSCTEYDRIYSVSRSDVYAYDVGGTPTADLEDWPAALGAPVVDGDGVAGNYNLAGGDRPDIAGDQGVWWVMNDVGNVHPASGSTPPIGLEVSVLVYAFARVDAIGSTVFYEYSLQNKSAARYDSVYATMFWDPDLGNASDDYLGSDSGLSLGYVYNGDGEDETASGYGIPPAFGIDVVGGPVSGGDTLGLTGYSYFISSNDPSTNDPSDPVRMYSYQQGLWGDGTLMRELGNGYNQPNTAPITRLAFNGDPVSGVGWSEVNPGAGSPSNARGDRRGLLSSGPFIIEPGASQKITFAMIFAHGEDQFDSVTRLKNASVQVQRFFDSGFRNTSSSAPPVCSVALTGSGTCLSAVPEDGAVTILWGYPADDPNYLGRFRRTDPLLIGTSVADSTYDLEGFLVYRYPDARFDEAERELVAVLDKANSVTRIIDAEFDPILGATRPHVAVEGSDSGVPYAYTLDGLANHTDVYLGMSSYVFNDESVPRVVESDVAHVVGRPSGDAGSVTRRSQSGDQLPVSDPDGAASASVAAPSLLTGHTYEVRFHHPTDAAGADIEAVTTYSVVNTTSGAPVMDGQAFYEATGEAHPSSGVIRVIDGFQLIVESGAVAGDIYRIDTADAAPLPATAETRAASLDDIQIVPNPYLGRSGYDLGAASRLARFTNLPDEAVTVRVFTVGGTLVKTLEKAAGASRYIDWDLTTQTGRPAASGMYLVHIQVDAVGERVLKFGLVQPVAAPE